MSEDGGKEFFGGRWFAGAHGDVHDVWIDPTNPQTVYLSAMTAECGTRITAAVKWWKAQNLPVSQFYHVSVDDNDPYPRLRRAAG